MDTLHGITTRVLNGLPVYVEYTITEDRYGDIDATDMTVFWTKKNKLGQRSRASIIEKKMTENDWDCLRDDCLDIACGRWIG